MDARAWHLATVVVLLASGPCAGAQQLTLPNQCQIRFAVIGDMGTASREQREVGQQMAFFHQKFPFPFVITVGDNILGADSAADFKAKFEGPRAALLSAGVKFYASLGNHDNPEQRNYGLFSMDGQRYYTFRPPKGDPDATGSSGVRFFAWTATTWMRSSSPGSSRSCRFRARTGRSRSSTTRCTRPERPTARPSTCARHSSRCSSSTA